jgi:hypothetical protein
MRTGIYVKDQKILDYINSQRNKSEYICNLIRKDMEQNKPITREEIIELIKRYAGTNSKDNVETIKNTLSDMFK